MPLKSTIKIDSERPSLLMKVLRPELGREVPRTTVTGYTENGKLIIEISAKDLPAMRAALNSYLRWIKVAKDILKITGEEI